MSFEYDFTNSVAYTTDRVYQSTLSAQFKTEDFSLIADRFDEVLSWIKGDELFDQLREHLVADDFMFGETSLLAFDNFHLFHACLQTWHVDKENWTSDHEALKKLMG